MTGRWMAVAVAVEGRKAAASRVPVWSTVLLVVGVTAIAAASTAAARSGNEQLVAKLGPLVAQGGWPAMLNVATQVTAAAGFLAFGVALSWIFGREFAEGTITGLFALPVTRPTIASAKLVVYLLWAAATAVLLTLAVAVTAAAVTAQWPQAAHWAGLGRLLGLALLTAALPIPAAWAATLGRGLLPAIATTVGMMAATQIVVVIGPAAAWFPLAAPALWALQPGTVSLIQLLPAVVAAILFAVLTARTWARLQMDR